MNFAFSDRAGFELEYSAPKTARPTLLERLMNATPEDVQNVPEVTKEVQSKAKQKLQVPLVCLRDYVLYWHKNAMLTRKIWVISHTLGVD